MKKIIFTSLYIIFGAGAVILSIFSLLAFINVKSLHIKEGKNFRGGMILLINTLIYGALAYFMNVKIQKINYEEEQKRNLDNFLELPTLNYKKNDK